MKPAAFQIFRIAAVLFCCLWAGEALAGAPKLRVVNPIVNFGEIEAGNKAEVVFSLKNEGDAVLEILEVHPACGCTAAMLDDSKIAPGKTGSLRATLETKNFSGRQSKTVRIGTNDPGNRSVVLTLEGTVLADFELDPARLYFGKVPHGGSPSKSVVIMARPGTDHQLKEIEASGKILSIREAPAANGGKTLEVTLLPEFPLGFFSERVTVKTTSPKMPIISIPVSGLVEGDVTVVPPAVGLGLVEVPMKSALTQELKVMVPGPRQVKLLAAEPANPLIKTAVTEVEAGKQYTVSLTFPADIGEQTLQSEVKLVTDHSDPAQREIKVAVNGSFVRRRE
jgi:hypothetical protein